MSSVLPFIAFSMVVIATPGPDTALTIRNTLLGGRRSGVETGIGVALGQLTWAVFTAAGLSALLAASEVAFTLVKLVGAAYLAYLGLRALRDAWRAVAPARHAPRSGRGAHRSALRQGLYSNLGNPKMAAFFTGLLPQFAPHESAVALLGLGCVFACLTLAWLSLYATAISTIRPTLERVAVRRVLDAITGCALLALAGRLVTERRA